MAEMSTCFPSSHRRRWRAPRTMSFTCLAANAAVRAVRQKNPPALITTPEKMKPPTRSTRIRNSPTWTGRNASPAPTRSVRICRNFSIPASGGTRASASFIQLFHPSAQHPIVWLLEIEKLDAHANARLDDAYRAKSFEFLVFPRQGDADPGVGGQWLAGAHKNSAHGKIRGYPFRFRAGFQVQDDHVRGKRIADAEAAIPYREPPGFVVRCTLTH